MGWTCIARGARRVIVARALDTGARFCAGIWFNEVGIANTLSSNVQAIVIGRTRAARAGVTHGSGR